MLGNRGSGQTARGSQLQTVFVYLKVWLGLVVVYSQNAWFRSPFDVFLQGMRDENSVVANQVREVEAKCLDGDIYNHVALCCCPWARCRGKLST